MYVYMCICICKPNLMYVTAVEHQKIIYIYIYIYRCTNIKCSNSKYKQKRYKGICETTFKNVYVYISSFLLFRNFNNKSVQC